MKHLLLVLLLPLFTAAFNPVQNDRNYQANIDLTNIVDDMVKVALVVPVLEVDEVIYDMPKIVPGTYKIYDYGQFVNDFKAFDSKGNELKFEKLNENQWRIFNAYELYKIEYWVSDSYDLSGNKIFAPAGTSIEEDAFLLNNFGFIGYLQELEDVPFTLEIDKPSSMYGTTSLQEISRSDAKDLFEAKDYFELHDCPILYAAPDTASILVAGMPITIGVYSKEGKIKAAEIRDALIPVFEAAATYLGGTLPAPRYTIMVYGLTLRQSMSGTGALEHHTSTVVNMPDVNGNYLKMFGYENPMQMYRDIVAHEFFHIVTPLNIHSEQIADYDFINPQTSEHLWFYEGVTEYNSMISQARSGVVSFEDFLDEIKSKMEGSRRYNQNIPFTEMSKYSLSFFGNQFNNVYEKGALIGLAVDLKLRSLSEGEFGLINLLEDMWQVYGADTFFVDEDLFSILAAKSFPQMEEFFVRHIAGTQPLPLEDLFAEVGIAYVAKKEIDGISLGNMNVVFSKKNNGLMLSSIDAESAFAKEMKLEKGDILREINGVKIDFEENSHSAITAFYEVLGNIKVGETISINIEREEKDGVMKNLKLKGKAKAEKKTVFDSITINENLTEKQRTLRHFWINN